MLHWKRLAWLSMQDFLQWSIMIITIAGSIVATRAKDVSKITADQEAFKAQKDQPGGRKTLKAWYWMVETQAYDQAHPQG